MMLRNFRSRLIGDSRGAVAIEYALLAILIAVGIVSALRSTKSGVSQQFDSASYNMNQATGGTQLAVKKVYAPTALTENGIQYTQVTTQFYAPGTGVNGVPGACPCTAQIVRTPVNMTNPPYQSAVFDIDNTLTNIIGVTTYNNDGSVAVDKRTPLYTGVAMVVHTDAAGSYTYRETQSPTGTAGVTAVTRTMLDDSGSGTFKTMQYVQDQSVAGTSTMIGSVTTNKDGTVTKTGQDISSYF
jgi:Flp pilus assembly pilin Flp